MKAVLSRSWILSLPLCTALLGGSACGDDGSSKGKGGGDGDGDGDVAPGDGDGSGDGDVGGGGQTDDAQFWYVIKSTQTVGVSNLRGEDIWTESLDARPIGVALGLGAAWVLTEEGALLRYDLKSRELVTSIEVAKDPSHIAIASGSVWVTDDNDGSECTNLEQGPAKLIQVDPETNSVTSRLALTATDSYPCNRFEALESDGNALYALIYNSFGVVRIDAKTASVSKRLALGTGGGYGAGSMTRAGDTLWVLNTNVDKLQAIGASDLTVASTTDVPSEFSGLHMVASAEAVYLDQAGTDILRVDAKDSSQQAIYANAVPDSIDQLFLRKGKLYATVRPELPSILLELDPLKLTTTSETDLPPFSSITALSFEGE